jgi:hypothetical protein
MFFGLEPTSQNGIEFHEPTAATLIDQYPRAASHFSAPFSVLKSLLVPYVIAQNSPLFRMNMPTVLLPSCLMIFMAVMLFSP